MGTASVRYIVDDVDAAIAFYTKHLGFSTDAHPAPGFAILARGDLRLLLNTPSGLEVDDLDRQVKILREAGVRFRNDVVVGRGGKQILLDDPAGNPIEPIEPQRA
jgi:catechol 2,3-dioxygenase-like lactoylglutathione lyase family enzyme